VLMMRGTQRDLQTPHQNSPPVLPSVSFISQSISERRTSFLVFTLRFFPLQPLSYQQPTAESFKATVSLDEFLLRPLRLCWLLHSPRHLFKKILFFSPPTPQSGLSTSFHPLGPLSTPPPSPPDAATYKISHLARSPSSNDVAASPLFSLVFEIA